VLDERQEKNSSVSSSDTDFSLNFEKLRRMLTLEKHNCNKEARFCTENWYSSFNSSPWETTATRDNEDFCLTNVTTVKPLLTNCLSTLRHTLLSIN